MRAIVPLTLCAILLPVIPCVAQSRLHVNAAAASGGDGLSWSSAFNDLQSALVVAAVPGSPVNEVWVAAGVYRPDQGSQDPSASFRMRSGLRVLGGFVGAETSIAQRNPFSNRTILSGEIGPSRSYHVVLALGVDDAALLDGFDIVAGAAEGSGAHSMGGGLRGEETALQISHCTFRGNRAVEGGAAYFINSQPLLFNCQVHGNFATGRVGGVRFYNDFTVTRTPQVVNCTFVGNSCVIKTLAPALSMSGPNSTLRLRNSVLWWNEHTTPTFFPHQLSGPIDAAYCCISESTNWPGFPPHPPNAIYLAEPRLVNRLGADGIAGTGDDDLRILPGSPCIDSGDASALPADRFDLDGDGNVSEPLMFDAAWGGRSYDDPATSNTGTGTVDMGAFEGPALMPLLSSSSLAVQEGGTAPLQVSLSRPPAADLTLALGLTGDRDIGVNPAGVTFTTSNWSQPQPVTVSAAEDPDSFEGIATITISGPAAVTVSVTAWERENDAPPGLVYVNAGATGANTGGTWADAFASLQAALNYAAASGGTVQQVWVAQGTYTPSGPYFAMVSGVALYGGFVGTEVALSQRDWAANPTVLSGDTLGDDGPNFTNYADNKRHVVFAQNVGPATRLDGFVIRGGHAVTDSFSDGYHGGGVYATYGAPLVVANCTLTANRARRGGGAYVEYSGAGAPRFVGCRFTGNLADTLGGDFGTGGGLFVQEAISPGATLVIEGCLFQDNTARTEGGGAHVSAGEAEFSGCEFRANRILHANGVAAGLYLSLSAAVAGGGDGEGRITSSVFREHTLSDNQTGGGAYITGRGDLELSGSSFTANSAPYGSGLRALSAGSPALRFAVSGCTFSGNAALQQGAGIYTSGAAELEIDGCTFSANTAGAGAALGSSRIVRNSVFINNSALTAGGAVAGGGTFEDCAFIGNTAAGNSSDPEGTIGGGAFRGSNGRFLRCLFRDNHATGTNGAGGAIVSSGESLYVGQCTFIGNSAHHGGAIMWYSGGGPSMVLNSLLVGNSATNGGAFAGNGIIGNCAVVGNTASGTGGGLYGLGAQLRPLEVRHSTVAGNAAPVAAGVYIRRDSLLVSGSVLWDNAPSPGPGTEADQIARHSTAQATVAHSRVKGWTGALGGPGNSGDDPLLTDLDGPDNVLATEDDSVLIRPGSTCIDAGRNADAPPDGIDFDGDNNLFEPVDMDISAGPRFLDDAATPDTGLGTPPIIDIGAAEFADPERLLQLCYANCDNSTQPPVLNVQDFGCFLTRYAAGDPYANCDQSTQPPVLNVQDFGCFLTKYAAGCP